MKKLVLMLHTVVFLLAIASVMAVTKKKSDSGVLTLMAAVRQSIERFCDKKPDNVISKLWWRSNDSKRKRVEYAIGKLKGQTHEKRSTVFLSHLANKVLADNTCCNDQWLKDLLAANIGLLLSNQEKLSETELGTIKCGNKHPSIVLVTTRPSEGQPAPPAPATIPGSAAQNRP